MHRFSAAQLRDQFIQGNLTASQIAQHYLQQVHHLNPTLGAFLAVYADQISEHATQLDAKRKQGGRLGKLAGVPIAIKDNILVKGEVATCGSKFLTNFKAPYQSTAVHLLLEEDALLIGKTNMDEFAMGSSTENSALQKTRNPYNLRCTPGGSSGGSAAAVAARMTPVALGSDTGGSVRLPASYCNVVGFKPTYGRISRYGLVAYASSLDQIGTFGTSVEDVMLLMDVIGKHCARDSTSIPNWEERYIPTQETSLQGVRIGIPCAFLESLQPDAKKVFDEAVTRLKGLGATTVEVDLNLLKYSVAVYYILATAEASTNLARFDGIRYGHRAEGAKTLDMVYDLSKEKGFGPEVKRRILLGTFVLSAEAQDTYYRKAQRVRTLIMRQYQDAFAHCDCIATPVASSGAFEIGSIQDPLQMYLGDLYTIGINLAGLPAISVPNGFSNAGMPMGLQLIGPQKSDAQLLKTAAIAAPHLPAHGSLPPLLNEKEPA